jgi:EpsD family peptidyl-prolyl cis-trans isomerase
MNTQTRHTLPAKAARLGALSLLAAALVLAGCGEKKDAGPAQTAAKVNKQEITTQQINFVLQQQRGLRPEQTEAASRQVLEKLIEQSLMVQKADDLKLDRDPKVMQQLDAVRREVLARAYIEKLGDGAAKPTADEIKKYYNEKPALFSERRLYSLQEIVIEAKPEQTEALRAQLGAAKNVNEFVEGLKASGMRYAVNQAVRAAEQLPLANLDAFARMKDGQAIFNPGPAGVQVLVLAGSRTQPINEEQAKPVIEQFLLTERKRKMLEDDIKAMRASAKISYVGKFADAASAPAAKASAPK